jgi:hypothetical protein
VLPLPSVLLLCSCIMGQQPGRFDAQRGQLLANLAEMLVRQLEVKWVRALQVRFLELHNASVFRAPSGLQQGRCSGLCILPSG